MCHFKMHSRSAPDYLQALTIHAVQNVARCRMDEQK